MFHADVLNAFVASPADTNRSVPEIASSFNVSFRQGQPLQPRHDALSIRKRQGEWTWLTGTFRHRHGQASEES
jgi:hypothetical protein